MKKRNLLTLMISIAVSVFFGGCATSSGDSGPGSGLEPAYKPVIYLYGYNDQIVDVTLDVDGEITCAYPEMTGNKWTVTARKNGDLKKSGRDYGYLFWEGNLNTQYDFSTGFCVSGARTESFLEESLAKLGLSDKEADDFITFWLPKMQNNPYNVIAFQGKAYADAAKLTVTPNPKKVIRVFMAYYPSDTEVKMKAQNLKNQVSRNETDTLVVEWGGAQVNSLTLQQLLPDSADGEDIAQRVAQMSQEEIQMMLIRAAEIKQANGGIVTPAVPATPQGHEFIDKNGTKYTFTDEEWKFLQNTWAYTGKANDIIRQFTIGELRAYIKNNMKK